MKTINLNCNNALKKILISLFVATIGINCFADSAKSAPGIKTNPASANVSSAGTVTVTNGVDCGAGTACAVVRDTSNKAIALINKNAAAQMTDVVTSQFDFNLMTRYALGNNWKLATPKQQSQLVNLFKQLLIRTYSSAMAQFKGAKTNILSATVSSKKAAVVSQITLPNNGSNNNLIKVEYDLANTTGSWKAYDIKIENASQVTSYRTQFNETVTKSGIDGLIKQLQDKVDSLGKKYQNGGK
ncbi:MAG: hypothetical protein K0R49_411 [Burkholderiales bacterium]|jgi:phospholipid transport system substrate-binding protein|nr:hypothetical protein [Burkholderiales bacterium]MCE3268159.1 hypothetical protein [Burkholderiales bacterium]